MEIKATEYFSDSEHILFDTYMVDTWSYFCSELPIYNIKSESNKYLKRSSQPAIRKMKIETALRFHLTPGRMTIIKNQILTTSGQASDKRETFYIVDGKVHLHKHYRNHYGDSSKNSARSSI